MMKLSLSTLSMASCIAVLLSAAGTANADIIANGTFSSGLTSWTTAGGDGTTPGIGITVIGLGGPGSSTPFGDIIPDAPGGTTNAVYFVDDNANQTLSQALTLTPDTSYTLSFDLFGVSSGANNAFNFELTDSVGLLASSCFANGSMPGCSSVPVGSWTIETLSFTTGAASSYTLGFNFVSGATPAKDVALTNVSIAQTPEPTSIALMGTGLLAAAGMVRRRIIG